MMADYIYMEVTQDEYELPVAIASTSTELAKLCQTTTNAIRQGLHRRKNPKRWSRFVRVDVEEVAE
jgi:hypothetical protein